MRMMKVFFREGTVAGRLFFFCCVAQRVAGFLFATIKGVGKVNRMVLLGKLLLTGIYKRQAYGKPY